MTVTILWVHDADATIDVPKGEAWITHRVVHGVDEAVAICEQESVDVLVSQPRLPDGTAASLFERVHPRVARILMVSDDDVGFWRSHGVPAAGAVVAVSAIRGIALLARWLVARSHHDHGALAPA